MPKIVEELSSKINAILRIVLEFNTNSNIFIHSYQNQLLLLLKYSFITF